MPNLSYQFRDAGIQQLEVSYDIALMGPVEQIIEISGCAPADIKRPQDIAAHIMNNHFETILGITAEQFKTCLRKTDQIFINGSRQKPPAINIQAVRPLLIPELSAVIPNPPPVRTQLFLVKK